MIGAGATGLRVASIFNAFRAQVALLEAAPPILTSDEYDVATLPSARRY